tara:strand:+ start:409 stop:579 length:171 start_codon:yes stop_codon:yes gene_type:complete
MITSSVIEKPINPKLGIKNLVFVKFLTADTMPIQLKPVITPYTTETGNYSVYCNGI